MISTTDITTIITDPNGAELLVKVADKSGLDLKNLGLTTNQIRALFGEVRQIQAQWENDSPRAARRLVLLKPKMAYRARRERGRAVQEMNDILLPALDLVIREKDQKKQVANFQRFVEFFEAILAYHKAYGGN